MGCERPISVLTLDQFSATSVFADLGSGKAYGSGVVTPSENGTTISFTLNGNAISSLNAAEGNSFAVGGSLDFATPTPEPASALLILPGLVALAWRKRRR